MTDSVNRVSAAKELERKSTRSGVFKGDRSKHHPDESGDDCVEISQEARDRASGKETQQ
ncbi:MAG: hypothetical protein HXX11_00570 [Desulfuromonadales bacterium]|nr:hypothetical protein [Desulfuromonadales bacterium]